jgi:hypothetical protein
MINDDLQVWALIRINKQACRLNNDHGTSQPSIASNGFFDCVVSDSDLSPSMTFHAVEVMPMIPLHQLRTRVAMLSTGVTVVGHDISRW